MERSVTDQTESLEEGRSPALPRCRSTRSTRKAATDFVLAVIALIVFAPLLLVVALAIMLDSRGPVLFRQRRTGLDGKMFHIYKFRSMHVLEDGGEIRHASRGDHRVTRVGAVLRRTSIDELPQLLNVVKGDMSLVGPRPHAVAHDQFYSSLVEGYAGRFRAKPGITGLAQVEGRRGEIQNIADMRARVALDQKYIDEWSFSTDLAILARTVRLVFSNDPQAY